MLPPDPPRDSLMAIRLDLPVSCAFGTSMRNLPQSSAQIAVQLHLSRSTVGPILAALDEKGWVIRLPDLTYQLGAALIAISERAPAHAASPGTCWRRTGQVGAPARLRGGPEHGPSRSAHTRRHRVRNATSARASGGGVDHRPFGCRGTTKRGWRAPNRATSPSSGACSA